MNNIIKRLESTTQEEFSEFFTINYYECVNCPARGFCNAEQDGKCYKEEFCQLAIEGGSEDDGDK